VQHDVLFVGHHANDTPGQQIQRFCSSSGHVKLVMGSAMTFRAQVHTIGGYPARADQSGLVRIGTRMNAWSNEIRPVHGKKPARRYLAEAL
jgi:metallo-beta-lactamase family protein